ncbi:MAG: hypothetical protein Q8R00_01375, partial [Candidatus Nanoarchaeia archaeon]|nr:hypothetical protein [Candidatus Nanoarchaeia archaeon]
MINKVLVGSSILIASLASLVVGYSVGVKSSNPKQMAVLFGGFMRPSKTVYITPDLLDPDKQW